MTVAAVERAPRTVFDLDTGQGRVRVVSTGSTPAQLEENDDGTWSLRRARNHRENKRAQALQVMRCALDDPAFWQVAVELPGSAAPARRGPGRPQHHPSWLYLLVAGMARKIAGSQGGAIDLFDDPVIWRYLCQVTDRNPHRQQLGLAPLGPNPPQRHHLKYFQRKWVSAEYAPHVARMWEVFRDTAAALALDAGLLDPDRPLDYDCIDPSQYVAADATVFSSLSGFRSRKKSGACPRTDDAAAFHYVGGDTTTKVYGAKVAYLTVRTDDKLGRVTLDVEPVLGDTETGIGNEAEATLAMLRRTVERLPGTRGIIVDSVLRGQHITDLAAEGLLVVNYPYALRNPNRRTGGRFAKGRKEKSTKVHVHTHTYTSDAGVECSCQHHIYVYGTVYHQLGYDAAGQQITVTLDVKNLVQRKNADGTYRWYHQLKVPCVHGDQTVLVALFHNPRKKSRGIRIPNRGEYLRAFPTNTIQHKILYGRRNDTESRHRQDKRTQPKMVAYGPKAQSLYNLGGAVFDNAMFRGHRLKRAGLPNPLDAT